MRTKRATSGSASTSAPRASAAGRDVVAAKVLKIRGGEARCTRCTTTTTFAWQEEHYVRTYLVIRKGRTPGRPGQKGFGRGSIGDESVILEGVAGEEADEALDSTVHGAGR